MHPIFIDIATQLLGAAVIALVTAPGQPPRGPAGTRDRRHSGLSQARLGGVGPEAPHGDVKRHRQAGCSTWIASPPIAVARPW